MKIKLLILAVLGGLLSSASALQKPNVIYILADDLGYGDIGAYGQQVLKTPALDRMAEQGIRFTDHYSGSTVCAPSRCSLMTGLHQGNARIRGNAALSLEDEDLTLGEVMKAAGYRTAMIGKWGLGLEGTSGEPTAQGFDYYYGYLDQVHAHNHYPSWLMSNGKEICLNNSNKFMRVPYGEQTLGSAATEKNEYSQALFTEETIRFIDESEDQPFFIYLASIIPHVNNEAESISGHHGMEVPDLGIYADEDWPDSERAKAAMISYLDADVGRILDHLEAKGLAENTLVIFSSDNGPHSEGVNPEFFASSSPHRGSKRDLYDGGVRVPMIAWWPGTIKAGSETNHLSAFWDVMPTLAELTHRPMQDGTDGISFLPTLLGQESKQAQHDYLYWEFHEMGGRIAIRKGKWKAVYYNVKTDPDSTVELYDITQDLKEQKDLSGIYPELTAEMRELMGNARTPSPVKQYNF